MPGSLDFAKQKDAGNPFFSGGREPVPAQYKARLAIVALALIGCAAFLIFHPFFAITASRMQVVGLHRIEKQEFQSAVMDILHGRKFFVFPGNAYMLLNLQELEYILLDRFPLSSLSIKKIFPNSLDISASEALSTILYDNGSRYAYVNDTGRVVELLRPPGESIWTIALDPEAETTTTVHYAPPVSHIRDAFGDFPILYDKRGEKGITMNLQIISEKTATGVLAWATVLEKLSIPLQFIAIEHELGDAVMQTGEGWELRADLREDIAMQSEKLSATLRDIPNRKTIQYIDIRFRDRVFWQ